MTVPAPDADLGPLLDRLAPFLANIALQAAGQQTAQVTVRPGTCTAADITGSVATVVLDGETTPVYAQAITGLPTPTTRVMVLLTPPHGAFIIGFGDAQQGGVPVGGILPFGGLTVPTGWLACDGATYLAAQFPALYAVIAENYGTGTAGTFKVPDLRGRFPLGADPAATRVASAATPGLTGGAATHALAIGELPAHSHTLPEGRDGTLANPGAFLKAGWSTNTGTATAPSVSTGSAGSGTAHNNMPPWQTVTYLIRAA